MYSIVLSSRVVKRTVQLLIGTSSNAYHCNAAFSNFEGQADNFTFNRDYFIDNERLADNMEGRPKSRHPYVS